MTAKAAAKAAEHHETFGDARQLSHDRFRLVRPLVTVETEPCDAPIDDDHDSGIHYSGPAGVELDTIGLSLCAGDYVNDH